MQVKGRNGEVAYVEPPISAGCVLSTETHTIKKGVAKGLVFRMSRTEGQGFSISFFFYIFWKGGAESSGRK